MQKITGFALAAALILAGCKDLNEFSTGPDESYCGKIVPASIVRRGFSEWACMRMTFDAQHTSDRPGLLWTSDGMFVGTPLRPLPELSNDPLLLFSFGDGREKNFLYAAVPTDPERGPSVMAVISLMHSGGSEVRLLRGAPASSDVAPDAGPSSAGAPLFGVFAPLERKSGTCQSEPGCNWMPE